MGAKKTITGEERTFILKVFHYFEQEKTGKINIPVSQVEKRVCAAAGISRRTLAKIKTEARGMLHSNMPPGSSNEDSIHFKYSVPIVQLSTPGLKRPRKLNIDNETIRAIKTTIENCYKKKQVPTLKVVFAAIKRDLDIPVKKETLRRIMTENLGYRFAKKGSGPKKIVAKTEKDEGIKEETDKDIKEEKDETIKELIENIEADYLESGEEKDEDIKEEKKEPIEYFEEEYLDSGSDTE